METKEYEVCIWTDGYEGRFAKWCGDRWQVFEHWNYRHSFGPPEVPNQNDIAKLRTRFNLSQSHITDAEILVTPPDILQHTGAGS